MEMKAQRSAAGALKEPVKLIPSTANLVKNGEVVETLTSELKVGDITLVRPGEKVPIDGVVLEGETSIIEVMGRTRGFLALTAGITAGAEVILVPELGMKMEKIVQRIEENHAKGKRSGIIVAAEGVGDTRRMAREIGKRTGSEVRLSVMGYAQRGGSPTARSRLLGCLFGHKAVELLLEGQGRVVVGLQNGRIASLDLEESCKTEKPLDLSLLKLANVLAT